MRYVLHFIMIKVTNMFQTCFFFQKKDNQGRFLITELFDCVCNKCQNSIVCQV